MLRGFMEIEGSSHQRSREGLVGSYKVFEARTIKDMQDKVTEAITRGWQPIGGPSLSLDFGWDAYGCIQGMDAYGYIQGMVHPVIGQIQIEEEEAKRLAENLRLKLEEEAKYNKDAVVVVITNCGLSYEGEIGIAQRSNVYSKAKEVNVLLKLNPEIEATFISLNRDKFEVLGYLETVLGYLETTRTDDLIDFLMAIPNSTKTLIAMDVSGSMTNRSDWTEKVMACTRTALPNAKRVAFSEKVFEDFVPPKDFQLGGTSIKELLLYRDTNGYKDLVMITDGDFGDLKIPKDMNTDNVHAVLPHKTYEPLDLNYIIYKDNK
jgi:hypothetical protein